ncbi:hypothetical protein FH597_11195 [Leptospira interrogans]|uniref:hypothetical protein n=1 Tax=Leptospira interrogans TaxID=173 RepID=UPI001EEFED1F|nr:hypothetical protein [Leptospira interrogans]ULG75787.1 hypothetical protein FH597_11195 [Leptospira interrogans]
MVLCNKIAEGIDTRNIGGESVVLSFPYFWVGDGGGKVRKIFLYQKNILFASKKTHSCRNT